METSMPRALCICGQRAAIYTCPRCSTHTCSLACSRSHKTLQSCSGERDRTGYVAMNKYGWGTMASDYVYLEEVGRRVVEWGNDIVKGGYLAHAAATMRGRGRGRARATTRRDGRGRRDVLKMQLDAREIDMEMLPTGMEKRRLNKSTWDVRLKKVLITLEVVFHSARDPLSPSRMPAPPPFRMLTHRNDLTRTLLDIVRDHITERGKRETLPSWVQSLASNTENSDDMAPLFLIAQQTISSSYPVSKAYYRLDDTKPLAVCLTNKSFVEYPTIDVWENGGFTGPLVEPDGTFVDGEDAPPPAKCRRVDVASGRKLIKSLLGEYGSDDECVEKENVLSMLGNYASEEEPGSEDDPAVEDDDVDEEDYAEEEDDDDTQPILEDLHDILEAVQEDTTLAEDQTPVLEGEDEVDWTDSGEEAAALERALKRQPRQAAT